jgi:hypothetical protein
VSDTPPTDREAELREQANRWSRSETGWERRAGESLSAALLILDGQRDMDAWLVREVHRLRAEVVELTTELTRLRDMLREWQKTHREMQDERNAARAEVESLRALLTTAAERVAARSELLGRRAEVDAKSQ